jgi:speckle-type POZ protein
MPDGTLVAVHLVGTEQTLSEKHIIRFVFLDFANLPHDRDELTFSPVALCHGHQWKLQFYPGGDRDSCEENNFLSLFLQCISAKEDCKVKAKFAFRVPSMGYNAMGDQEITTAFGKDNCSGFTDFLLRSDVLDPFEDFLVDRNLTIEIDIQVYMDKTPAWRPKKTMLLDLMKILESAKDSGDVKFQVGREEFSAHRPILQVRAPELAALVKGYPSDTPIPIQDIKPSVFRSLLHFVYTDDVPKPEELKNEARELLDAADRFGCKGLKLAAEAELAESGITVDTAAEIILFADGKTCALLKEVAIDFFASNPTSVMSSSGWAKLRESASLLAELMEVLVNNNKKRSAPADDSDEERDTKRMCVSSLRRKLDEKGLDVDGSREMLIRRLEEGENDVGSDNSS